MLAGPKTKGERIRIEGRVIDGSGTPVRDVLLEIWQANAAGRYNHPADRQARPLDPTFRGWGRACSDFTTGVYTFDTIKPGAVIGRNGRPMAPHVNFWIVARGINIGLSTRMYFSDEAAANAKDPVLNLIEWEVRRKTLIGAARGWQGQCSLPLRHSSAGSGRDGVLRRLKATTGHSKAMIGNCIGDAFDGMAWDSGIDAEYTFVKCFTAMDGAVVERLRNPDCAPCARRA